MLPSSCIYLRKCPQQPAATMRNVVHLDNTQLLWAKSKSSHLRNHYFISGVTIILITPLGAKSGGKKPGATTVSELSAAPILFSWPKLEDWQCYSPEAGNRMEYVSYNNCTIFYPT